MTKVLFGLCGLALAVGVVAVAKPELFGLKSSRPAEPPKVAVTPPPAEKSGCGSDDSCCCAAQAKKCSCGGDEPELTPARVIRSTSTVGLMASPVQQNLLLASSAWVAGREKK